MWLVSVCNQIYVQVLSVIFVRQLIPSLLSGSITVDYSAHLSHKNQFKAELNLSNPFLLEPQNRSWA